MLLFLEKTLERKLKFSKGIVWNVSVIWKDVKFPWAQLIINKVTSQSIKYSVFWPSLIQNNWEYLFFAINFTATIYWINHSTIFSDLVLNYMFIKSLDQIEHRFTFASYIWYVPTYIEVPLSFQMASSTILSLASRKSQGVL